MADFTIDCYSGESLVGHSSASFLVIEPFYYHPSSENNFVFNCDYIAPNGNVNLIAPDEPCSGFDFLNAYTGEVGTAVEILTEIIWPAFGGETADVDLLTFKILQINTALAGENAFASLALERYLVSDDHAGETLLLSTITLPVRAELSSDNYTGEYGLLTLQTSVGLSTTDTGVGENSFTILTLNQYADYIKSEGPSAYWKLDETSGTVAADYSGNGWTGTYVGEDLGTVTTVASKRAVYLDGTDTITSSFLLTTSNNFTQEFWAKPDSSGTTLDLFTPSNTGNAAIGGAHRYVNSMYTPSGGASAIDVGKNGIQIGSKIGGQYPVILSYQHAISTTDFTHILVSWTNGYPSLYVNGELVAVGAYASGTPYHAYGLPNQTNYGCFKGYLQDAAVYPTALTAAQAREHYLAGLGLHFIPRLEIAQNYSGEYSDADLTTDPHINLGSVDFYDGAEILTYLEAHPNFTIDQYAGERADDLNSIFAIVPNSTFTHFHGAASHNQTSTCLTLYGLQSSASDAGINAYFALPNQLVNDKDIAFNFKRTVSANWWDDDFTDAALWFCFFPNYTPASITFYTGSWAYDVPNYPIFSRALIIRMRRTQGAIRINWTGPSGVVTNDLTVISNWTTTELNGTDSCSIVIRGTTNNTIFTVYGKNNAVRQSGTFANMPDPFNNGLSETIDTFLIHHHNYLVPNNEVLCDMSFGTEGFILTPFVDIGPQQAYSDENGFFSLSTTDSLDGIGYTGENAFAVLDTHLTIDLSIINGYVGERGDASLQAHPNFIPQAYTGEGGVTISFDTHPTIPLVPTAYAGERGDGTLWTQFNLTIPAYTGEGGVTISFDTHPSQALIATGYAGERGDTLLSLNRQFLFPALTGERGDFTLTYVVNVGMPAGWYAGETAFIDELKMTYALPLTGYAGERGNAELSTEYIMSADGRTGENFLTVLTAVAPIRFVAPAYTAEVLAFTLSTKMTLPGIGYAGELNLAILTTNPAPAILVQGYTGATASAAMMISIHLPMNAGYTGERATITSMANDGFYFGKSGERAEADLATTSVLPIVAYAGENSLFAFDTHPSGPIGILRGYSGEWVSPGVRIYVSASLYVLFRTSIMTQCDIDSTTYFDLTTDLCCGPRPRVLSNIHFELALAPEPSEVYSGDKIIFSVDLMTRPRFSVDFTSGTTAYLEDRSAYLEVEFKSEGHIQDFEFETLDLRHRLCKGYFIPSGDWVVVELTDVLPEDCYVDKFYTGEKFWCELSDSIVLRSDDLVSGETFYASLVVDTPWILRFYSGQTCSIAFPWEIPPRMYAGERLFFTFYEPNTYAYAGSTAMVVTLETTYGVRFLETGCVDNEFVFQNDDGDAVVELFNEVPVEGEPFKHDVKAQCF